MASSATRTRIDLAERLRLRRGEICHVALTRVNAVFDASEIADPAYMEGLRAAVSAALDYGVLCLELGERRSPPPPVTLLAQARLAARNGVSLSTVLRRYFGGYTLLADFVVEEAESSLLDGATLKLLLRDQATVFDRLLAAVADEYDREVAGSDTSEQRRAERVRRLLDGELLDTTELEFDFASFHLGVVANGPNAANALRAVAGSLDRQLLLVHPDKRMVWAWLGGRDRLEDHNVDACLASIWPDQSFLAIGVQEKGLSGWRASHYQAAAALPVAVRRSQGCIVRYADVALLAAALQDSVLASMLQQLYIAPLEDERDGGEVARRTLRAYFAARRNISSAAAALGMNRRTVASRLRVIEDRLGRPIDAAELEVALDLNELIGRVAPPA
jgi:hypothetical protein